MLAEIEDGRVKVGQRFEGLSPRWRRVWQVQTIFAGENGILHARLREVGRTGVHCTLSEDALLDETRFRHIAEDAPTRAVEAD